MKVYLTDTQQYIDFDLGKNIQTEKLMLILRKIIPSMVELILPVISENQEQKTIEWESTTQQFELFKKLYQSWVTLELRLNYLAEVKKNIKEVAHLITKARHYKQTLSQSQHNYSALEMDYLFLLYLHGHVDAELVMIGEPFYIPTFKAFWQDEMSHLKEPM